MEISVEVPKDTKNVSITHQSYTTSGYLHKMLQINQCISETCTLMLIAEPFTGTVMESTKLSSSGGIEKRDS